MRTSVLFFSLAAFGATGVILSPAGQDYAEARFGPPQATAAAINPTPQTGPVGFGTLASSYSLAFKPIPAPTDGGNGGAIAAMGSDVLILSRLGTFSLLDGRSDTVQPLPLPSPRDVARLENQFTRAIQSDSVGFKDLVIREKGEDLELTVSYLDLDTSEADCISLAISRTTLKPDALVTATKTDWTEVYRSEPCIPAKTGFFLQAGGALAYDKDDTLYVFVGDFGLDSNSRRMENAGPQIAGSDVGKVLAIAPNGTKRVISQGHRNPGGLAMTRTGDLFSAEHGPRGGDELNLVVEGADFGWPAESFGTHYGELNWPADDTPGLHDRFDLPAYAWVPSIAVSSLIELQGPEFPLWDGDLILATLKNETLRRLRVAQGRVIVDEPIHAGARIRDLTLTPEGRLFLMLDKLPYIVEMSNANSNVPDIPRGLAQCVGCHQINPKDMSEYAGPTLVGVMGRPIGSVEGYAYSTALNDKKGVWDEKALRSYMANTQAFAPGSSMPPLDVGPIDVRFVIESLTAMSAAN